MDDTTTRRQQGLGLLELIIALALGAALSAGVVQLCLALRQADRVENALAQMQQSARFIHALLQDELHRAGDFGCAALAPPLQPATWLRAPLPPILQAGAGIAGWEALDTGPGQPVNMNTALLPITITTGAWRGSSRLPSGTALPHADMLQLWGRDAEVTGFPLLEFSKGSAPRLSVGAAALDSGDLIIVSDCTALTLLQVCRIGTASGQPPRRNIRLDGNCTPGNHNLAALTLTTDSEVHKLNTTLYYLARRGRTATNPPALYRRTLSDDGALGAAEELVEGVASLQLRYAQADAGNPERYVTADQVGDWHRVVSVHVALLLQSLEDRLSPSPQPYDFNGLHYDGASGNGPLPDDRRLRRAFEFTIALPHHPGQGGDG